MMSTLTPLHTHSAHYWTVISLPTEHMDNLHEEPTLRAAPARPAVHSSRGTTCVSTGHPVYPKWTCRKTDPWIDFWWTRSPFHVQEDLKYKSTKEKTVVISWKNKGKRSPPKYTLLLWSQTQNTKPKRPKITTLLHGADLFQINLCLPPIRPVP